MRKEWLKKFPNSGSKMIYVPMFHNVQGDHRAGIALKWFESCIQYALWWQKSHPLSCEKCQNSWVLLWKVYEVSHVWPWMPFSVWISSFVHIELHYDLCYYVKSTKYWQGKCSFEKNVHKFVLVFFKDICMNEFYIFC